MSSPLSEYEKIVGASAVTQLRRLGEKLGRIRVVHVNSTREGGGVAEILEWMVPLMRDVGLEASWEVLQGNPRFYRITKAIHNGLQGRPVELSRRDWSVYREVNEQNARRLRPVLEEADIVGVHDPQPAPLLSMFPKRKGKGIWRGHIDISRPHRPVWKGLHPIVKG